MTEAEKREKVIRGLEAHANPKSCETCAGEECPYYNMGGGFTGVTCSSILAVDALALLKEQEAKELSESCENCNEYDNEKHYCPKFCRVIRETVDELLKEQEPRILSWREVKRLDGIESPAVWLEDYDKIHVIPALGLTTGFMDDDKAAFRVRGRTVTANCSDYGKRWRAWTSRPTQEQRKEVPWDEPTEI